MGLNKKELDKVIDFVKKVKELPGNEEFIARLREVVKDKEVSKAETTHSCSRDIQHIKDILCIKADASIDYSFISSEEYPHLKRQLVVDNLRMENAILDTRENSEYIRFYNFCTNAFYQIENIVNHYYFVKFPDIQACIDFITNNTGYKDAEGNLKRNKDGSVQGRYTPKPEQYPQIISDIAISYKITAFLRSNGFDSKKERLLDYLREVRNLGAHRCMSIWGKTAVTELSDKKLESLFKFYKYNTANSVRNLLNDVIQTARHILHK